MKAVVHTRSFAGGMVEVRAHTPTRARRLAGDAARLAAAVACPDAEPARIRAWPAGGALPYLVLEAGVDDPEVIHRLLIALRRRAGVPLRASVAVGAGTPSRTWDGRWMGVARLAA